VLTANDMWTHQKQLVNDKDFDPNFSQLGDFTGVTEIAFTADDVRSFAERNIFSPQSRRAFVAKSDALYSTNPKFLRFLRKFFMLPWSDRSRWLVGQPESQ
jgi:hypothetical protein